MGIFGGNGFQGPGEEFGNSWDSFKTGIGNHMTGPQGAGQRVSGFGDPNGQPMMMGPQSRPWESGQFASYEPQQQPGGLFPNGLFPGMNLNKLREERENKPDIIGLIQMLMGGPKA
jgi:hypothetical protein